MRPPRRGWSGASQAVRLVVRIAPKSVSLLWAFGTDETSSAVSIAQAEATSRTLEFLEERAAVARQQTNGVRRRVATRGFAVAAFVHRTSRDGDPQLHAHCLIPNVIQRAVPMMSGPGP